MAVRDRERNETAWKEDHVYDATLGRFIRRDPIGFAAGDSDLYRYVAGSPTILVDPFGLACAPTFTLSSDIVQAIGGAFKNSFLPGGKVQEQGGSIIITQEGTRVIRPASPGSARTISRNNFPQPGAGETFKGTFHTHPNDPGESGAISFSWQDIIFLKTGSRGKELYVGTGTAIYVLTIDNPERCAGCDPNVIRTKYLTALGRTRGTEPFDVRVDKAVRAATEGCGFCYYKANLTISIKPQVKPMPPLPEWWLARWIAVAVDFVSRITIHFPDQAKLISGD